MKIQVFEYHILEIGLARLSATCASEAKRPNNQLQHRLSAGLRCRHLFGAAGELDDVHVL
jgi:hypothetical protein